MDPVASSALAWYFYRLNDLSYHIIGSRPLHFPFGRQHEPVTQYGRSNIDDVFRRYKVAPLHGGHGLGSVEYPNAGPGRRPQVDRFMIAGCANDSRDEMNQFFFYVQRTYFFPQLLDPGGRQDRLHRFKTGILPHLVMIEHDPELLFLVGVMNIDLEEETVQLRLRQ